jgi:hypothetical protein
MFKSTIAKWAVAAMLAVPAGSIFATTISQTIQKATGKTPTASLKIKSPVLKTSAIKPAAKKLSTAKKLVTKKVVKTPLKTHYIHHTTLTATKKTAHPLVKMSPKTALIGGKTVKSATALKTAKIKPTALKTTPVKPASLKSTVHTATKLSSTKLTTTPVSPVVVTPHVVVKTMPATIDGMHT